MVKPLVDEIDRHIARRLKKLRQQQGVSAQALAEAINSTQQQISRYENAHNKLSATQLYRIATVLGMPVSWFFYDEQNNPKLPRLAEESAQYHKLVIADEMLTLSKLWPNLHPEKRAAILQLIAVIAS